MRTGSSRGLHQRNGGPCCDQVDCYCCHPIFVRIHRPTSIFKAWRTAISVSKSSSTVPSPAPASSLTMPFRVRAFTGHRIVCVSSSWLLVFQRRSFIFSCATRWRAVHRAQKLTSKPSHNPCRVNRLPRVISRPLVRRSSDKNASNKSAGNTR